MSNYYVGALVSLSAEFRNAAGELTDPTDIVLTVSPPSRTALHTYNFMDPGSPIVRDSQGKYHYDLAIDRPDLWQYRWAATGTVVAVGIGEINVGHFPINR